MILRAFVLQYIGAKDYFVSPKGVCVREYSEMFEHHLLNNHCWAFH